MKLTEANYHSLDANKEYWSVSQFKEFRECSEAAKARLLGLYQPPETDALLMGSFIDAHFSGTLGQFQEEHPELYKKDGTLKAQYRKAMQAAERVEAEPMLTEYLGGDSQAIMTGEICGLPWKVKIDSLHPDKIVDLKYMKDLGTVYKNGERQPFVQAYGYDLQGFIYQEIVRQNTGKKLPFYLAVVTKEDPPDVALIHVGDKFLNVNKGMVEHYLPEFNRIKTGEEPPEACGSCPWCRQSKTIEKPMEYEELFED